MEKDPNTLFTFPPLKHIGLAVSGGRDSMVMLHHAFLQKDHNHFTVLTLNHKIRPESQKEVLTVKQISERYGFKTHILEVETIIPKNGIQAFARRERYRLLADKAKTLNLDMVCIAHHKDDLYETLIMRLNNNSGFSGLNVMPSYFRHQGMLFHRPMLSLSREKIDEYSQQHNLKILDDPSNHNSKYERIRIRKFLKQHSDIKKDLDRLYQKAYLYDFYSTFQRDLFIKNYVQFSSSGYAFFSKEYWDSVTEHEKQAILKYCIRYVTGRYLIPNFYLHEKSFTIGYAYIHIKKKTIEIYRENRNLTSCNVLKNVPILFDKRFKVTPQEDGTLVHYSQEVGLPFYAQKTLPLLKALSGKNYYYTDLNISYCPESLYHFNSNLTEHH